MTVSVLHFFHNDIDYFSNHLNPHPTLQKVLLQILCADVDHHSQKFRIALALDEGILRNTKIASKTGLALFILVDARRREGKGEGDLGGRVLLNRLSRSSISKLNTYSRNPPHYDVN